MATKKRDVMPILDIQNAEFAEQYQLGAWWARYGDEQGNGPQPDTYFITNVTRLLESGHLNDLQSVWFPNLGFFLGMVHGGLLNLQVLVSLAYEENYGQCSMLRYRSASPH